MYHPQGQRLSVSTSLMDEIYLKGQRWTSSNTSHSQFMTPPHKRTLAQKNISIDSVPTTGVLQAGGHGHRLADHKRRALGDY